MLTLVFPFLISICTEKQKPVKITWMPSLWYSLAIMTHDDNWILINSYSWMLIFGSTNLCSSWILTDVYHTQIITYQARCAKKCVYFLGM